MGFSTSLKTHEKSTFIPMVFSWEFHGVDDSFEIFMGPEKMQFSGDFSGHFNWFFMPFSWHKNHKNLVVI